MNFPKTPVLLLKASSPPPMSSFDSLFTDVVVDPVKICTDAVRSPVLTTPLRPLSKPPDVATLYGRFAVRVTIFAFVKLSIMMAEAIEGVSIARQSPLIMPKDRTLNLNDVINVPILSNVFNNLLLTVVIAQTKQITNPKPKRHPQCAERTITSGGLRWTKDSVKKRHNKNRTSLANLVGRQRHETNFHTVGKSAGTY